METRADQTRALMYAIGVHLAAVSLLFIGLVLNPPEKPVIAGAPMDAVLIDMSLTRTLPSPPPRAQPAPAPKPEPKPVPPPPPPQQQAAPEPEPVTDQRPVLPTVPDENALSLERERQRLAEQQERLRAEQQREIERMEQLERIRKEREQLSQQQKVEEQRLQQLDAARARDILNQASEPAPTAEPAAAPPRGEDVESNLLNQYAGMIQQVVEQNWRRPLNTPPGIRCTLRVRQIPGGDVISVTIASPCVNDPLIQQSIVEAVERASPLPYAGFEDVFQSSLTFNFRYDG